MIYDRGRRDRLDALVQSNIISKFAKAAPDVKEWVRIRDLPASHVCGGHLSWEDIKNPERQREFCPGMHPVRLTLRHSTDHSGRFYISLLRNHLTKIKEAKLSSSQVFLWAELLATGKVEPPQHAFAEPPAEVLMAPEKSLQSERRSSRRRRRTRSRWWGRTRPQ